MVDRTLAAVKDRLTKEITYWDHRAQELKAMEEAGKTNAKLKSELAQRRADDLQARLQVRTEDLSQMRRLAPQTPVVIGGALIIPIGLLKRFQGEPSPEETELFGKNRKAVELAAMEAVITREQNLGFSPVDVSEKKLGWDIESNIPGTGRLRFIEVKGRVKGSKTVTVSKNEIIAGLNKPDEYTLAIVEVLFENGNAQINNVHYIPMPFQQEPDFAATSINYDLNKIISLG